MLAQVCGIAMVWLALCRRAYFLAFFFFLFGFGTRIASVTFIEATGPVYSLQLERMLYPNGSLMSLVASYMVLVAAVLVVFRRRRIRRALARAELRRAVSPAGGNLANLAFYGFVAFVGGLYVQLWLGGEIPLLTGMERYDFSAKHGGVLHGILMEWANIFALQLGVLFVRPRRHGRRDRRFLALLVPLLFYFFLTGHRFSAFYATTAFFLAPVGFAALRDGGSNRRIVTWMLTHFRKVFLVAVAVVLVAGLAGTAVYNSYFNVRANPDIDPMARLMVRVLIEPGELWHQTHERVFGRDDYSITRTYHYLFPHSLLPGRNSTPPYLMYLAMGPDAYPVLENGTTFAGGFPELAFEAAGPWAGFVLLFALMAGLAEFAFRFACSIWDNRLRTALLYPYVFYAFAILLVSGMVNFLARWTFWVKALVVIGSELLDASQRNLRLRTRQNCPRSAPVTPALLDSHLLNPARFVATLPPRENQ
jgi:hypothetical protein